MPYKILENEATADIAFVADGKTLGKVFKYSAMAVFDTMADRKSIGRSVKKKIILKDKLADGLLIKFLEEIVFLKDSINMLFSDVKVKVEIQKGYKLTAELIGERIDAEWQKTRTDVKAITLHMFKLEKTKKGWKAKVVLDI